MNTIVIQVPKTKINEMLVDYARFIQNKKIPYAEFSAKKNDTVITAYTSGKVVFQGIGAEKEASRWGVAKAKPAKKATSSALPAGFSSLSVIGSDEVGNGSYFGPVTVAATYVDKNHLARLKSLGVRDSKAMTDTEIRKLAKIIKQEIPFQLLVVPPEKYNQIQPNYNAVHMKVALHNQAIYLLLKKISPEKPEAILIDQFTPEANYSKYVRSEKNQVTEKIYFATKGEGHHLAVAAASILSRAAFLEELDKESDELGIIVPSGAGKNVDSIAAQVLQKGGLELLGKYAKLHFANTKKAQNLL
ncbi:MAG: ribonuclease HIII [Lactobacillales bacterium]|nr:ribonuclease HIII [Lactobacillales bacterium]